MAGILCRPQWLKIAASEWPFSNMASELLASVLHLLYLPSDAFTVILTKVSWLDAPDAVILTTSGAASGKFRQNYISVKYKTHETMVLRYMSFYILILMTTSGAVGDEIFIKKNDNISV